MSRINDDADEKSLVKHAAESEEIAIRPGSLLQVIAQAVADPRCDVEKMRALFELQKDIKAEERRIAFDEAMTRLQAAIKHVPKLGQGKNSKYARYEDLDATIRPLYLEEGFNLSFSEKERDGDRVTFVLEVARGGYSKFYPLTVHADTAYASSTSGKPIRPAIQDDGSSASYARRYLVKLALNIIESGEDTNGEQPKPINADQATEIRDLIKETKSDEKAFLELIAGAASVEDIQQRDYRRVINALQTKKRVAK